MKGISKRDTKINKAKIHNMELTEEPQRLCRLLKLHTET